MAARSQPATGRLAALEAVFRPTVERGREGQVCESGASRGSGKPRVAVAGLAAAVSPLASRVVFLGVCLLAAFAPLAFGAVDAWARAIVLLVLALLGLVWVGDAIVRRRLLFRPTLLYAPLAGFLCWAALQLAFQRTLYRHGTREELVWGAGLALAWTLAFNALNAEELRRLPLFLAIFGSALALFAILQGLAAPHDTIYLFRELAHGPTAYGPFINKNHYAGYMELLAPLPLALVMYLLGTPARRKARREAEEAEHARQMAETAASQTAPNPAAETAVSIQPDAGRLPSGDPVAPERKEP